MSNVIEEFIKETSEDLKKLGSSDEYKELVARKKNLIAKKNTIIDEIFEFRNASIKVETLTKIKQNIEDAIKEIDLSLKSFH
jgi:hypothetical protein